MLENYTKLPNGVIKQIEIKEKKQYDQDYIETRYNTYGEKGMQMAFLRLGYLISSVNKIPESVLDIGYGNGDFLKACSTIIKKCYGNDVSGYQIPDGCTFVKDIFSEKYEVVTFYDVLEHFENINFVKDLKTDYIVISVPWCHYTSDSWFKNWKHRREDEHLYHFDNKSIVNFFKENGFELVNLTNVEDSIRKNKSEEFNILTCVFKNNNTFIK